VYCLPAARVTHFEQNRTGVKKGAPRIVLFHQGAFQFYRKHHTRGLLDPRTWFAAVALSLRAVLLIGVDQFLPASPGSKATESSGSELSPNEVHPADEKTTGAVGGAE